MPEGKSKTRVGSPLGGAHTPSARDAALRRLSHARRWLLGGSVTLTGVLAAVAAGAFPGKSVKSASATSTSQQAAASSPGAQGGEAAGSGESSGLQGPAQEPQASASAEAPASSGAATEAPVVSGGS